MKRKISIKKTAGAENFYGIIPPKPPLREYTGWTEFVEHSLITALTEREKNMVIDYLTKIHQREMDQFVVKGDLFEVTKANEKMTLDYKPVCYELFRTMINKVIEKELKKSLYNLKIKELDVDVNLSGFYYYVDNDILKNFMRQAFIRKLFTAEVFKKVSLLNFSSLEDDFMNLFIDCLKKLNLIDKSVR